VPLSPLDVHNKEFRRGFRGYVEEEVDEFLDQVVRDLESLLKENEALREQLEAVRSRVEEYRRLEDTLHNTLVVAQSTAEEVKESARKEAEIIISQAREEARRVKEEVQTRLREMTEEGERVRRELAKFLAQSKSALRTQVELIEEAQKGLAE